jgi:hypothetical protein
MKMPMSVASENAKPDKENLRGLGLVMVKRMAAQITKQPL